MLLVVKSTVFIAEIILRSPSQRMRLLYFPITSAMRIRVHENPISSRAAKVNSAARSKPCCLTSVSLAPVRCLRRSRQNTGGLSGLSAAARVSPSLGAFGPAFISRRQFSPLP